MPAKQKGKQEAEDFTTQTKASSGSLRVSKASSSGAQAFVSSGVSAFSSGFSLDSVAGLSAFSSDAPPPRDPTEVSDDEVQFCFKALSRKRDLTTKLKAFKQLEELFQSDKRSSTELEQILPAFVTHLKRLAMDNERRVREALFQCFGFLVAKIGKQLAPQLKRVFPIWWVCQSDPCREVAKAATQTFALGFPQENKRPEVLKFCRAEYLAQVSDFLSQTPQTMSDMKVNSVEEADARYDRVLQATLASLALYTQFSLDNQELFADDCILGANGAVWKLSNSKRPSIRKGLYTLCHTLAAKVAIPTSVLPCIAKLVLYSANDNDKTNLRVLWEAMLHLVKMYPACWEHIDSKKVWNVIFDTLRKGCYGSGNIVYPYLLPILACVPPSVTVLAESSSSSSGKSKKKTEDPTVTSSEEKQQAGVEESKGPSAKVNFFKTFLDSLWRGRLANRVDTVVDAAPVKYDAVIQAFWECAVFIITQHWNNTSEGSHAVIHSVILPTLENELLAPRTNDQIFMPDAFFTQANTSLATVLRTLANEEDGKLLWQAIESLCGKAIQEADDTRYHHVSLLLAGNLRDLPPCMKVVQHVFQQAYKNFASSLAIAPLALCMDLASQYGFAEMTQSSAVVGSEEKAGGKQDFVVSELLPTLKLLCKRSQQYGTEHSAFVQKFAAFFSSALSAREKSKQKAQKEEKEKTYDGIWDDILAAVATASPEKGHITVTFCVLITVLVLIHSEVWGHPALDALILAQVEKFMLCKDEDLFSQYVVVLRTCLGGSNEAELRLSPTYTATIVSSLFDAVLSFAKTLRAEEGKDIEQVKKAYFAGHEIHAEVLPSIFPVVAHIVRQSELLRDLSAHVPTIVSDKDDFIQAAFSLRECAFWPLAQAAIEFFHDLDGELLPMEPLERIAKEIQTQMRTLSRAFDSEGDSGAARAWALRAVEIVGCVKSTRKQQQLLSAMLPPQQVLRVLIEDFGKRPFQEDGDAEVLVTRSECVLACVFELLLLVGPAVIFHGEHFGSSSQQEGAEEPQETSAENERPWLVASLLCLEEELSCWTSRDVQFKITTQISHCIREKYSPPAVQQVFEDLVQLAKEEGEEEESKGVEKGISCYVAKAVNGLLEIAHANVQSLVDETLLAASITRSSGELLACACLDTYLTNVEGAASERLCNHLLTQVKKFNAAKDKAGQREAVCWVDACGAYFEALSRNSSKVALLSESVYDDVLAQLPLLVPSTAVARSRLAAAVIHLAPDVNKSLEDVITPQLSSELLDWVASSFGAAAAFTPPPLVPIHFFHLRYDVRLLAALAPVDFTKVIPNILQFFVSPVFLGLGVTRGLEMLADLARVVSEYFDVERITTEKQALLSKFLSTEEKEGGKFLEEEVDPSEITFSPFAPVRRRSPWTSLCSLLSHPCGALAACAHLLLCQGLRDRIMRATLKQEAAEELLPPEEAGGAEEDSEKEVFRQSLRARLDRERQENHLETLLPSAVIRLTRSYIQRKEWSPLQLRGYFLLWSALLECVSLPAFKTEELDKKAVIIRFLRDSHAINLVCSELFEHINVSLTEEEVAEEQALGRERLKSGRSNVLTGDIFEPNKPKEDLAVFKYMTRLRHLRRTRAAEDDNEEEDEESEAQGEECIFFGRLAFRVYLTTLATVPALTRAWFTNAPRSQANAISQWTSKNISLLLIEIELAGAVKGKEPAVRIHVGDGAEASKEDKDDASDDPEAEFKITCNLAAAEVVARYKRGEISLGVVIRLAKSHPLLSATVELIDTVKIQETRAKRWQLAIATTLTSQNGSIHDAIMAWRRNVEKHFQGVEECPICYSVLDNNRSLPRMACRTCNNKFHPSCLYTWFNTSGNSKCPLCRKLF